MAESRCLYFQSPDKFKAMTNILTLATAGLKPSQLVDTDHVQHPRVDYIELQRLLDTDVLDYTAYDGTRLGSSFRYLETQIRSDLYLTLLGLLKERDYRLIFAMSERAGIPLAGLHRVLPDRKPLVSMFQCWSQRQENVITKLNLFSAMDAIIVHCQSMKRHFIKLGAPAERIYVIPYSVDHRFFSPLTEVEQQANFVMSVGEIRSRDYATLFQAVADLPVKLMVAASGSWYAREKNTKLQTKTPENVMITGRLPRVELRKCYAQSQFVVLPVYDLVYSAGATAALEAGCMGRAVIATRSQGIVDFVINGKTGILVNPGDVAGMREAIHDLLAHPEEARRLGQNARQRVEEELNLDVYVERIAQLLRTYL
jgi:glycosyltransferase involved in cell wall biosynthesis